MKHIPQAETTQMELLPFERALEESGKGDEYDTENGSTCRIITRSTDTSSARGEEIR